MTLYPQSFYRRRTILVAKQLLGSFLCCRIHSKVIRGVITEVEVYDGFFDKASHASRGKTKRNEIMFCEGGVWYVYFTYGMHWMLNVVTDKKEYPAAILIRAIQIEGAPYKKTNGPAKLTKFLKIGKQLNGKLIVEASGLWIEKRQKEPKKIFSGKRIGVDYAGAWKHKLWRFYTE